MIGAKIASRQTAVAAAKLKLNEWFDAQAKGGVKALFSPYLDFEKWK